MSDFSKTINGEGVYFATLWPGSRVRVATSPASTEGLHCLCMEDRAGLGQGWGAPCHAVRDGNTVNSIQTRGMGHGNCSITLERDSQEERARKKVAGLERKWEMTAKSSERGSAILTQNLWDGERVFLNLNFTFLKLNIVSSEALYT